MQPNQFMTEKKNKTTFLKKVLLIMGIFAVIVCSTAVYTADVLLEKVSETVIDELTKHSFFEYASFEEAAFENASFEGINTLQWNDVSAKIRFHLPLPMNQPDLWQLTVEKVSFRIDSLSEQKGNLSVFNMKCIPDTTFTWSPKQRSGRKVKVKKPSFSVDSFTMPFTLQGEGQSAILKQLMELKNEMRAVFHTSSCSTPIHFKGQVNFSLNKKPYSLKLSTVIENDRTLLRADVEDVRKAAAGFGDRLTPEVMKLIAENPLQLPKLVSIKVEAEDKTRQHFGSATKGPADAYRHILWSYLLTREFGPVFAAKVTDAHETSSGGTKHEHERDLLHNALGRKYFMKGIPERDLINKLDEDPKIQKY